MHKHSKISLAAAGAILALAVTINIAHGAGFSVSPNPPTAGPAQATFITGGTPGYSYAVGFGICTLEYSDLTSSIQDNCGTTWNAGDTIHIDEYNSSLGAAGTGSIVDSGDFTFVAPVADIVYWWTSSTNVASGALGVVTDAFGDPGTLIVIGLVIGIPLVFVFVEEIKKIFPRKK